MSAEQELVIEDHEYLTFKLGGEEFGVDILSVQEIRVWSPVTEIPNTPDYLNGVINLRGVIVPIIDLRRRFNHSVKEHDATTVVIVLQGVVSDKRSMVGIVVDEVSDVCKVEHSAVKDAPDFGSRVDNRFIEGMATMENHIIILLNSEKLLDVEELFHQVDEKSQQVAG